MIHGVPQGELPLFVVGRSMSARTSDCLKFAALLYTTSVLLSATFLRSYYHYKGSVEIILSIIVTMWLLWLPFDITYWKITYIMG